MNKKMSFKKALKIFFLHFFNIIMWSSQAFQAGCSILNSDGGVPTLPGALRPHRSSSAIKCTKKQYRTPFNARILRREKRQEKNPTISLIFSNKSYLKVSYHNFCLVNKRIFEKIL